MKPLELIYRTHTVHHVTAQVFMNSIGCIWSSNVIWWWASTKQLYNAASVPMFLSIMVFLILVSAVNTLQWSIKHFHSILFLKLRKFTLTGGSFFVILLLNKVFISCCFLCLFLIFPNLHFFITWEWATVFTKYTALTEDPLEMCLCVVVQDGNVPHR